MRSALVMMSRALKSLRGGFSLGLWLWGLRKGLVVGVKREREREKGGKETLTKEPYSDLWYSIHHPVHYATKPS